MRNWPGGPIPGSGMAGGVSVKRHSKSEYVPALRFDRLTPHYDALVDATTREHAFKDALIGQAGIGPGHQVLDLACGTGTMAIRLKQIQPSAHVTGVDGDPVILSIAAEKSRKAGVGVRFDQALSCGLPYRAASFDRIVSSLFFHHLTSENKRLTARELFRVLKPDGELHIADWGPPASLLMRALFLSVRILDGFENTRDNVSGNLGRLFEQAAFVGVERRRSFNTLFGTMVLYRALKPRNRRE